jgi:acetate kinase
VRVLVLNAGSSSLKASVVDTGLTVVRTGADWGADATRAPDRAAGLRAALGAVARAGVPVGSIEAVGHRVVHGGGTFTDPVLVDESVLRLLDALGELAPLHNAVAIETIRSAIEALPGLPQVACFDTAFHARLPEPVVRYPVPPAWHDAWGIRRFGFHGLSVAWAVERAGELLGRPVAELGLVVAHLGSGCSVTAVSGGHSVQTSMGFTPLEGLMMGTRAGSLDPGILLHLLRTGRLDPAGLADALEHRSGLLGVSGLSSDVRELEAAADAGHAPSELALAMFVQRAAGGIASAATALDRLDAVVFTGGIGEHAGRVRAAIVDRLGVLGLRPILPGESGEDRILGGTERAPSRPDAPAVLRVEAREDLVIARAVEAAAGVSTGPGRPAPKSPPA